MDTWLTWLIGVAGVVAAVLLLPWLAQRTMDNAGGAGGGNPFGVLQEIFHPAAHRAEHSVVEQKEREQPAPDGEDDNPGADDGTDDGARL